MAETPAVGSADELEIVLGAEPARYLVDKFGSFVDADQRWLPEHEEYDPLNPHAYDPGLWWVDPKGKPTRVSQRFSVECMIEGQDTSYYVLTFVPRPTTVDRAVDLPTRRVIVELGELTKQGRAIQRCLNAGMQIVEDTLFLRYLRLINPPRRYRLQTHAGWTDDLEAFWFGEQPIGITDTYAVLRGGTTLINACTGSLEGQRQMLERLADQPLGQFAVCAALAGPTLVMAGLKTIGVHYYGGSSTGKSALLHVMASVFGVGVNNWDISRAAAEYLASASYDTTLLLDELETSKLPPQDIMLLLEGTSARRAHRDGTPRAVLSWRCVIGSTGEISLQRFADMRKVEIPVGTRGRLLELSVSRPCGVWDPTPGLGDPARFTETIRELAQNNTGWLGRAFIERLVLQRSVYQRFLEQAREVLDSGRRDGIVERGRRAFACVLAAGLAGCAFGVLPWDPAKLQVALLEAMRDWEQTSARLLTPAHSVVQRMHDELVKNQDKFPFEGEPVRGQVWGYRKLLASDGDEDEVVFAVLPAAFKELIGRVDKQEAISALVAAGMLIPGEDHPSTVARIKGLGKMIRVYMIRLNGSTEE